MPRSHAPSRKPEAFHRSADAFIADDVDLLAEGSDPDEEGVVLQSGFLHPTDGGVGVSAGDLDHGSAILGLDFCFRQ